VGPPAATPNRTPIFIAVAAVAVAGIVAYLYLARGRAGAPAAPAPAAQAAGNAASAPIEFPEPQLGKEPGKGSNASKPPPAPAKVLPQAAAPVAAALPPAAATAKHRVQFSSIPVATLFVDGKQVGPSIPAKTMELAEGTHHVRFEADGLETYQREFKVGAKETNRVAYQFPVGYLVIKADSQWAGAAVIIGGKYKGSLPQASKLRLPKGSYSVTLHREGFQPVTQQITVAERGETPWAPPPPVAVEQGIGQ
jgi:hypothetical protein